MKTMKDIFVARLASFLIFYPIVRRVLYWRSDRFCTGIVPQKAKWKYD